jgi:hypothetical protein
VRARREPWLAALGVTVLALVATVLDFSDGPLRRWWDQHAFVTSLVTGILVLLVTVLVADRVVSVRQLRDRSRAIAAQGAIVMSQAARATRAVIAAVDADGDRDTAADELRTYMTMLLISAPLLIDAVVSRAFLEQAQSLAAELARTMAASRDGKPLDKPRARLDSAVDRMRAASQPLLEILNPEERTVVTAEDPGNGPDASSDPDPGNGPDASGGPDPDAADKGAEASAGPT